jgi:hypothetical protein
MLGILTGSIQPVPTQHHHLLPSHSEDCVMLIYQRDVLHMGAKFGKENGAYLYFVYRIKGNLR